MCNIVPPLPHNFNYEYLVRLKLLHKNSRRSLAGVLRSEDDSNFTAACSVVSMLLAHDVIISPP
jgi:hypothetical protein